MRRDARSADGGFVLLEALMALVVWTLIFATMLIAGNMVARRSAEASATAADVEALDLGLHALRRDLQAALPVLAGSGRASRILFEGSETALSFVAGADSAGGRLDERVVTLRAEDGLLTRQFRALSPLEALPLAPASGDASTLISGPWLFRFSYSAERSGQGQKVARWTGEESLPGLVHLDVVTADGLRVMSLALSPRVDSVFRKEEPETPTDNGRLVTLEPVDG